MTNKYDELALELWDDLGLEGLFNLSHDLPIIIAAFHSVAADERERAVVIAEQYNDPYDANDIGIRIAALIRGEKENDNE